MVNPARLSPAARRFYEAEMEADPDTPRKLAGSAEAIEKLLATGWPANQLRERVAEVVSRTLVEIGEPRGSDRWKTAPALMAELVDQLAEARRPRLRLVF